MSDLILIGQRAKEASVALSKMMQGEKNRILTECANALMDMQTDILEANARDVAAAREKGVKDSLIDRLLLTPERLKAMADGLLEITAL